LSPQTPSHSEKSDFKKVYENGEQPEKRDLEVVYENEENQQPPTAASTAASQNKEKGPRGSGHDVTIIYD
jgi:hypothetical protein